MYGIPEQNGARITIAIGVNEWLTDPFIRWHSAQGGPHVDRTSNFQITGRVYRGWLFSDSKAQMSGIELGKLTPLGRLEQGMTVSRTKEVKKDGSLKIYPAVMKFANMPYWTADDWVKVKVDSSGRMISSIHAGGKKS